MGHTAVHTLSVLFAAVAGAGAGLLSLLSWTIFRESPFGVVVFLLSVGMSAVTVYHAVLPVLGPESLFLRVLRSATHTVIAILVLLLIRERRRLRRDDPAR